MSVRQGLCFLLYISRILAVSCICDIGKDGSSSSQEFVFSIPKIRRPEEPHVMITTPSSGPVNATLCVPGLSLNYNVTITRSNGADIQLPRDVKMNRTIIVRSSDIISVYAIDNDRYDTDAFQILPTSKLGRIYHVASYRPQSLSYPSFISISALQTSTSITIKTPTREFTVLLKQYESYRYNGNDGEDLSGTVIYSDEPITAISGSLSGIPASETDFGGSIVTQLLPTDSWGITYYIFPFVGLNSGYIYRVFSSNKTTSLCFSNGSVIEIQPNSFFQGDVLYNSTTVVSFESNHPVMVAQYMKSRNRNSPQLGGASMSIVPPVSSYTNNVTFPTFIYYHDSTPKAYYINVVIKCDLIDDLFLNGIVPLSMWNDTLNSDDQSMCCVRGEIWRDKDNPSYNCVTHTDPKAPFVVFVYALPLSTCRDCRSSYLHTALGIMASQSSTPAPSPTPKTCGIMTTLITISEISEDSNNQLFDVVIISITVMAVCGFIVIISVVISILCFSKRNRSSTNSLALTNSTSILSNNMPDRQQSSTQPTGDVNDGYERPLDNRGYQDLDLSAVSRNIYQSPCQGIYVEIE